MQNFENQNPANTLWTKQYNVWSKIDTEAERYLGFEKYWGGLVQLNAEEMQWIVDELFVGNQLAAGEIRTSDGTAIDLRNIRSPIVVFCSKGDNITPPQQALDWILDLYDSVDEIRAHGQTIVYTIHDKIGHLGIFVSAGVARKEHDEFASNIDLIDVLPPGLYEAVLTPKGEAVDNPDLVTGEWVMRCEARTLDDIRALGGNDLADERKFEAAARVSEINLSLYRAFARPVVRALANSHDRRGDAADASDAPVLRDVRRAQPVPRLGRGRRRAGSRRPSPGDSRQPAAGAAGAGVAADRRRARCLAQERGAPRRGDLSRDLRRAGAAGGARHRHRLAPARRARRRGASCTQALVARRIGELKAEMTRGGLAEAVVRALIYVGLARGVVDERGFAAIRDIRATLSPAHQRTLRRVQGARARPVPHAHRRRGRRRCAPFRSCSRNRSRSAARRSACCGRCSRRRAR